MRGRLAYRSRWRPRRWHLRLRRRPTPPRSTTARAPRPGPDILYEPPRHRAAARRTRACGRRRRSWSPARPPTATASSSTRTSSTTTTAPASTARPGRPARQRDDTFSSRTAPTRYPTDAGVRAATRPTSSSCASSRSPDATAFRLTLNTLNDPELRRRRRSRSATARRRAAGARTARTRRRRPQFFLTVARQHGGAHATPPPARPSARRRGVTRRRRAPPDRAPRPALRRGTPAPATVRLAAGAGLWDTANDQLPRARAPAATADRPGGAGAAPAASAFFNVAFRTDEPLPDVADPASSAQPRLVARPAAGRRAARPATSAPSAPTSTSRKLAAGTTDDSGVPTDRPDQPHPRLATSRPSRASTSRRRVRHARTSARASCAAASSRTRSTCPQARADAATG